MGALGWGPGIAEQFRPIDFTERNCRVNRMRFVNRVCLDYSFP